MLKDVHPLPPTSFRLVFGNAPAVRVMDFFMDGREFDHSMTDLIEREGIAYNTLRPAWEMLIKMGVLKKTRRVGKSDMYVIDKDNEIAKRLLALDDVITDFFVDEELATQAKEKTIT